MNETNEKLRAEFIRNMLVSVIGKDKFGDKALTRIGYAFVQGYKAASIFEKRLPDGGWSTLNESDHKIEDDAIMAELLPLIGVQLPNNQNN